MLPIAIGAFRFKKLELGQKLLLLMISLIAANQFLSRAWSVWVMENNLPFFYVYVLIELVFLIWIYSYYLNSLVSKKKLFWLGGIFTGVWVITFSWPGVMWQYPSWLRFVEGILVLSLCGGYFIRLFREGTVIHIERTYSFWMSAGLVVYFSSNLLLFLFSEFVVKQDHEVFRSIWIVHAILSILLYLSFSIALLCKKETTL